MRTFFATNVAIVKRKKEVLSQQLLTYVVALYKSCSLNLKSYFESKPRLPTFMSQLM